MNKFDTLYESVVKEQQIDENLIHDIWDKLRTNSFDRIIMYDFVELVGTISSSNSEQRTLLKNILTKLKTHPKITNNIIKFYKQKDGVDVKSYDIYKNINILYHNSNKRFEIHKQVRDEKANEYVQQQLQEILSI